MHTISVYDDFELEYFEYGEGKRLLIAFHGFGRDASEFNALESHIGEHYKIVAINYPFQGKSKSVQTNALPTFSKAHLQELIKQVLTKYSYQSLSLLGYSLGGRVALCCKEVIPEAIDKIYLFAPDGLKMSKWYQFSSGTMLGRCFLKYLSKYPNLLFNGTYLLNKLGLMPIKMCHFINQQMETAEKRAKVYLMWVVFRSLLVSWKHIQFKKNQLHCYFGKYDVIIPSKFSKILNQTFHHVYFIDSGHNMSVALMGSLIQLDLNE